MSNPRWTWRYLPKDGVDEATLPKCESFTSQGDAESFIGEDFPTLWEAGVASVVLVRDNTDLYTMSLAEG